MDVVINPTDAGTAVGGIGPKTALNQSWSNLGDSAAGAVTTLGSFSEPLKAYEPPIPAKVSVALEVLSLFDKEYMTGETGELFMAAKKVLLEYLNGTS